jgi:hypothetical protein
MFLRNVAVYLQVHKASQPKRPIFYWVCFRIIGQHTRLFCVFVLHFQKSIFLRSYYGGLYNGIYSNDTNMTGYANYRGRSNTSVILCLCCTEIDL